VIERDQISASNYAAMHDMQEKNVEVRDQNWETWGRRKTFEQVVEVRVWNSSKPLTKAERAMELGA